MANSFVDSMKERTAGVAAMPPHFFVEQHGTGNGGSFNVATRSGFVNHNGAFRRHGKSTKRGSMTSQAGWN